MAISSKTLIWLDLEMTGLNCETDRIIEIALILTDRDLNILEEGPEIAIYQPDEVLDKMDNWNTTQHTKSGLIDKVRKSKITERKAENIVLDFLKQRIEVNSSPMCGNSICQDRRFLAKRMPSLEKFFHYRNLDVSTVKELAKYWAKDIFDKINKEAAHTALSDIKESISELKHYKDNFFKLPS